jgi:hypothetical protein
VSVQDANPQLPAEPADAAPHAESGRGMRIVATLADRWGVENAGDGKAVWFELEL